MVVIICGKYGNNRSGTENVTEQTRFSMSRSNDLEDICQGQRSSHATHLFMLVIISTKYGKNQSGTVHATERTRFSRPMPNDLEDIGQGQRSLYVTHFLWFLIQSMDLNMVCHIYHLFVINVVRWEPILLRVSIKTYAREKPGNEFEHI